MRASPLPDLGRFVPLVTGDLGLRFAYAKVVLDVEFPRFSDDELEDWLVREALMVRWRDEQRAAALAAGADARRQQEIDDATERVRKHIDGRDT